MNARVMAVYDRSTLGDLAIETAFEYARSHDVAELHILAMAESSDDVTRREVLTDDLLAFAKIGQHHGMLVDGAVINGPDVERIVLEIRQRKIDHLVIVEAGGPEHFNVIAESLKMAAKDTGVATINAREEIA